MKIVVVMPTYNERENIDRMIETLFKEEFPRISAQGGHDMHLLIVDDNSPDGTGEIVNQATKKYKKLHLMNGQKQGLGYAYVRGMKYAMNELSADAVMEMDADFQHDPKDVKRLMEALDKGADVVIGSRYIQGGSVPKEWEFYRKFISFFGNLVARTILFLPNIHDVTTGFRLTKTKFLQKVDLDSLMSLESFAYKMDLLFRLIGLGARVVEVPIAFLPRKKERSKFSSKETFVTLKTVILLRLSASARFFKFATVGGIGFLVNAISLELFRYTMLPMILANFFSSIGLNFWVFPQPSAWAAAAAAEVAIFSNFNIDNYWTFRDVRIRASRNPFRYLLKFFEFNFTSIGAVIIQFVVIGTGVIFLGDTRTVRLLLLVIAVVTLIVPYNYTVYNLFIWKRWKSIPWLSFFKDKI